jgi:dimethylsulfone monooxygenase
MRLGIWAPAPQTLRPDAELRPAFQALTRHGGGVDASFEFATGLLQRAEEIGFEISLIAQRFLGPDLDSWIFASALAAQTKRIELMAAVHPGIMDPRITAKMGASLDRISGGRFCVNIVNGGRPQEFAVF